MNPWTTSALAGARAHGLRLQAAPRPARPRGTGPRGQHRAGHWPAMRRRIGFRLVEAGLPVLASARPAP